MVFQRSVLAAIALSACGMAPNVPAESKGDTPIQVSNWMSAKICDFSMTRSDAAAPSANWLGWFGIPPSNTQSFGIKPGDYTLSVGCGSTFHGERRIRIAGPTFISIGAPQISAPAGWAHTQVAVAGRVGAYQQPVNSGGGGGESGGGEAEAAPAETAAAAPAGEACKPNGAQVNGSSECCSHNTESHGYLHNGGTQFCCAGQNDCHNTAE